jgi:cytochrome c
MHMKTWVSIAALGIAAAAFQVIAHADDGMAEAKEHGCLACHDVEKKKVGPAYKEVAAKFKGKSVDALMADMKSKPVHKGVLAKTNDASLKKILSWVLSL